MWRELVRDRIDEQPRFTRAETLSDLRQIRDSGRHAVLLETVRRR